MLALCAYCLAVFVISVTLGVAFFNSASSFYKFYASEMVSDYYRGSKNFAYSSERPGSVGASVTIGRGGI